MALRLNWTTSKLYTANLKATTRHVANYGGTSSGKTYTILQVLATHAIKEPSTRITVVGQDVPNLKRGAINDFNTIRANTEGFDDLGEWNATDKKYRFNNGSWIEFVSYDNWQDAKNGKRDYLFANEANGIQLEIIQQLMMRTSIQCFYDWNPSHDFWGDELLLTGKWGDVTRIHSTYKNNPYVSSEVVKQIEQYKETDPYMWQVYGLGLKGRLEGLVFDWGEVDGIPKDAKLLGYGVDFGFSTDPMAVVGLYRFNGDLYVEELLYKSAMHLDEAAKALKAAGMSGGVMWADSAEPRSIATLQRLGMNVAPVKKTADQKRYDVAQMRSHGLYVTRSSRNLLKELQQYQWVERRVTRENSTKKELPTTNDHAIDAMLYGYRMTFNQKRVRMGRVN